MAAWPSSPGTLSRLFGGGEEMVLFCAYFDRGISKRLLLTQAWTMPWALCSCLCFTPFWWSGSPIASHGTAGRGVSLSVLLLWLLMLLILLMLLLLWWWWWWILLFLLMFFLIILLLLWVAVVVVVVAVVVAVVVVVVFVVGEFTCWFFLVCSFSCEYSHRPTFAALAFLFDRGVSMVIDAYTPRPDYIGGYYFWMDALSWISVIPDTPMWSSILAVPVFAHLCMTLPIPLHFISSSRLVARGLHLT